MTYSKEQQKYIHRSRQRGVNPFKGKNAKQKRSLLGAFGMTKWMEDPLTSSRLKMAQRYF
jgi:hypothetical protein